MKHKFEMIDYLANATATSMIGKEKSRGTDRHTP